MPQNIVGRKGCWVLAALPLLIFLLLPIFALAYHGATTDFVGQIRKSETMEALAVSLRTTAISLLLILLFGTPVAFALGRFQSAFRNVARALVALPAVLPPAAAGLGLLLAFGRQGLLGGVLEARGITVGFTPIAVIMAQVFVACPFYVLQAAAAFERSDRSLEECAALDGAATTSILSRIVLPINASALIGAATLAWARALGEFGATILFAGNMAGSTRTMPLAIYLGFEGDLDEAVALAVILMVVALIAVVCAWSVRFSKPNNGTD